MPWVGGRWIMPSGAARPGARRGWPCDGWAEMRRSDRRIGDGGGRAPPSALWPALRRRVAVAATHLTISLSADVTTSNCRLSPPGRPGRSRGRCYRARQAARPGVRLVGAERAPWARVRRQPDFRDWRGEVHQAVSSSLRRGPARVAAAAEGGRSFIRGPRAKTSSELLVCKQQCPVLPDTASARVSYSRGHWAEMLRLARSFRRTRWVRRPGCRAVKCPHAGTLHSRMSHPGDTFLRIARSFLAISGNFGRWRPAGTRPARADPELADPAKFPVGRVGHGSRLLSVARRWSGESVLHNWLDCRICRIFCATRG